MASKIFEQYDPAGANVEANLLHTTSRIAQTFTVGNVGTNESHVLEKIELNLKKIGAPTGDIILSIYDVNSSTGLPRSLLTQATLDSATVGAAFDWMEFSPFSTSINLEPNTTYAIVYQLETADTAANMIEVHLNDGGLYVGGRVYGSINNGATWDEIEIPDNVISHDCDIADIYFRIYGDYWNVVTCTHQQVLLKAGADVSATSSTVENVQIYAKEAEQTLNALTRYDWTTEFPNLTANTSGLVTATVSGIAAIYMVNYDHGGYETLEAQRIVQNLTRITEAYIEELKQDLIQKFMGK